MNIFEKRKLKAVFRMTLVALLILLQITLIFIISNYLKNYSIYVYVFIEVLSMITILRLISEERPSSVKILWILIILLLPITGHLMYDLWGKEDLHKKKHDKVLSKVRRTTHYNYHDEKVMHDLKNSYGNQMGKIAYHLASENFPIYNNTEINYINEGKEALYSIIEDIKSAEKYIMLSFYIIEEGQLWNETFNILKEKINKGVEVKLIYDDVGTMFKVSKDFKKELIDAGIEVVDFNPVHKYFSKLYLNFRNNQKIVVIDGNIAYTGSTNLSDENANIAENKKYWKDNMVRLSGEGVWGLTVIFLQMWEASSNNIIQDYNKYKGDSFIKSNSFCQPFADGPANNPNNPIAELYKNIINAAEEKIYITTSTLVLEDDMIKALCIASKSGVDVRIITPASCDKKTAKLITEYNYGKLLRDGVKIYEFKPGTMHSKIIANEKSVAISTVNMSYRDFYINYECGVWICDENSVNKVKEDFIEALESSEKISYEQWGKRSKIKKIFELIVNVFSILY